VSNRVAPLDLQITCAELWSSLSAGDEVIGADQVDELGDPDRALAAYTDRAIRDVARETGRPERALRAWLEATFVTAHGTRGLAYRGIARTADEPNSVVDALVDRHILTGEQRAGSTWYQLAQNRLVEAVRSSNRERQITVAQLSPAPTRTPADFQAAAEAALGEGDLVSARRFAQVAARRSQEQGDERRIAQLLAFQGQVARVEGDLEAARESLVAARTEFESQQNTRAVTRVLTVLAEVCLSMDNVWEAVDLGRQAVARSPGDIEARTVLGYAMWRAGSPADAEAHFNDALDLDRNAARAAAGRGRVRVELRDYLRALADLDHALELGLPADEEPAARSARQRALDLSA
jgi:tetratricopeptide (TPR) repeat protein